MQLREVVQIAENYICYYACIYRVILRAVFLGRPCRLYFRNANMYSRGEGLVTTLDMAIALRAVITALARCYIAKLSAGFGTLLAFFCPQSA